MKYKVGDMVRVIKNTSEHKFHIGDIVTVRALEPQDESYLCSGDFAYWYLGNDEVEALNDAS